MKAVFPEYTRIEITQELYLFLQVKLQIILLFVVNLKLKFYKKNFELTNIQADQIFRKGNCEHTQTRRYLFKSSSMEVL